MSSHRRTSEARPGRKEVAQVTLEVIRAGSYFLNGVTYELSQKTKESERTTRFYNVDSILSSWRTASPSMPSPQTEISFLEMSTLAGARRLSDQVPDARISILNFASAKNPGGGFLSGAQAQEESIARSSNLYPTLITSTAQQFYKLHKASPKEGFYSHSMIYSPDIVVFRNDRGDLVEPLQVDVLTSPAVNAGLVRRNLGDKFGAEETEEKIANTMRERMARILYLLEKEGVKNVVLGSFGTGVFKNKVDIVARIWAEHLSSPGARFQHSFHHVVFAILGHETFKAFKASYELVTENTTKAPQKDVI
ncbi:hypothetical protein AX15_006631 [Amanita polypyramis BW_CC]|nr:hypothetical protein AX15_006631 [Amanita polypyramis BW_CC]